MELTITACWQKNNIFKPSPPFQSNDVSSSKTTCDEKKDSENMESAESFFEIFGIKLFFDDILIICILLFLYNEKVKDESLFVCLILLLLS